MSSVRGARNRSTEWRLRSALVRAGLKGWRVTPSSLPGKPDFAFDRKKLAVFADGCFWHGCPKCYRRPKSRRGFWDAKVRENIARDHSKRACLRRMGWRVVRIWEHELVTSLAKCVERIQRELYRR